MVFFTSADFGHYRLAGICADQVVRYFPEATYVVYDLGMLPGQVARMTSRPQVKVVPMVEQVFPWGDTPGRDPPRNVLPPCLYKPWICKDALERFAGFKELIYLDADAMPWKRFVFPVEPFDVAVTLRPQKEIQEHPKELHWLTGLLNAGVMFFRPTPGASAFVEQWLYNLEEAFWPSDQEQLNKLVARCDRFDWKSYYQGYTLWLDQRSVLVRILPCSVWNVAPVGRGHIPETAKIIHLKGRWHSRKILLGLLKQLELV